MKKKINKIKCPMIAYTNATIIGLISIFIRPKVIDK